MPLDRLLLDLPILTTRNRVFHQSKRALRGQMVEQTALVADHALNGAERRT